MAKVKVFYEIDESAIPSKVAEYAIDWAMADAMNTQFGSMAVMALEREHGQPMLDAAIKLIGEPLRAKLDPLEAKMDGIIAEFTARYVQR